MIDPEMVDWPNPTIKVDYQTPEGAVIEELFDIIDPLNPKLIGASCTPAKAVE